MCWMQRGKTVCKYSMDEALTNEITDYLQKDIIMDFTGYEEDLIRNGLTEKTDHVSTLQPVPEKMHQVWLQSIIIHLRNLSEIIP